MTGVADFPPSKAEMSLWVDWCEKTAAPIDRDITEGEALALIRYVRASMSREPKPQSVPPAEDYAREYKLKVLSASGYDFNETPDCQCDACWDLRDDRFSRIMRAVFNTPEEVTKE